MRRKPPQKAKLLVIENEKLHKPVTQEELQELESAQRAEWHTSRRAALLSEKIRVRIEHGAKVDPGPLYYCVETRLARGNRRKQA